MTREQLARKLATRLGKKYSDTRPFIDAFCQTVEETLIGRENILLTGFGTFEVRRSKSFETLDIHGKPMIIGDALVVNFRAGRNLKKALNQNS